MTHTYPHQNSCFNHQLLATLLVIGLTSNLMVFPAHAASQMSKEEKARIKAEKAQLKKLQNANTLPQRAFLPPVASINPVMNPMVLVESKQDDTMEAVSLTAVTSPTIQTRGPVTRLDGNINLHTNDDEFVTLLDMQHSLDEEDLNKLWNATVEKNPVIRFSMEKVFTPRELQPKKSSVFMRKTLNAMITAASIGTTMLPGVGNLGSYQQMGTMAVADAARNLVNGPQQQGEQLSATELIQLAGLVDELKGRLIHTYHDYKNTLQTLSTAHDNTIETNNLYSKALGTKEPLAVMAAGTAYYKALIHENGLRQNAKLYRLELERLAGVEAVNGLALSVSVSEDILRTANADEDTEPVATPAHKGPSKQPVKQEFHPDLKPAEDKAQ